MSAMNRVRDGSGGSPRRGPCRSAGALTALAAVSVCGLWLQAMAAPPGAPVKDRIFAGCTFTTAGLRAALNIPNSFKNSFVGDQLQASYILVYVRQNPNDGQPLDGTPTTYTGPVLCINSDTETIDQTTETTPIPNSINHSGVASVNLRGAESAFHLQYELAPTPGDIEKRVCHTVAGNTDCFFIQPQ